MSDQIQGRIQLQLYVDHTKSKQNIEIQRSLSYHELISKVQNLIKRQKFRLQLHFNIPKTGQSFRILTQKTFKEILSSYKGQKLNINTKMQQENPKEQIPINAAQQNDQKRLNKGSNNHALGSSLKKQAQMRQQKKQQHNQENKDIQLHLNKKDKLKEIPQKIIRSILHISHKHEEISWSQSCRTQQNQIAKGNNLKKVCSQCQKSCKGSYFICLVCKPEVIFCNQCQSKEDFMTLKSHKFRQHPFAKIKRWTQQITSLSVATQQTENSKRIQLKEKNIQNSNIGVINQLIDDKLCQAIQKRLLQGKKKQ